MREFKVDLDYLASACLKASSLGKKKGRENILLSPHLQDSISPVVGRGESDLSEKPHPALLLHTEINKGSRGWGCSWGCRVTPWDSQGLWVPVPVLHKLGVVAQPLISTLRRFRKEDQAFKVTLSYIVSLRSPWAA